MYTFLSPCYSILFGARIETVLSYKCCTGVVQKNVVPLNLPMTWQKNTMPRDLIKTGRQEQNIPR